MGEVNLGEWARVVQEVIDREAEVRSYGSKTRAASRIGVNVRTLDTWLLKKVRVKEDSVRAVAAAYDMNPIELLVRVGYYSVRDVPLREPTEEDDPEIRKVLELDIDDATKCVLIDRITMMRAADRERRMEQIDWMVEQQRKAG